MAEVDITRRLRDITESAEVGEWVEASARHAASLDREALEAESFTALKAEQESLRRRVCLSEKTHWKRIEVAIEWFNKAKPGLEARTVEKRKPGRPRKEAQAESGQARLDSFFAKA